MLTARDGVDDRLRGLHGGADDYVVKPFVLAELVARVTAVLRRMGRARRPRWRSATCWWTPRPARCGAAGVPVELTATELRLLDYLAAQRGRVVSARARS